MTVVVIALLAVGFVLGYATAGIVREARDLYAWGAARRREQSPTPTRAVAEYVRGREVALTIEQDHLRRQLSAQRDKVQE